MLTKEYTLLEPFMKEPWKSFTFKEIKKLSRNNSDNYVHYGLKRFVKSEILKVQKVGNVLLYSLSGSIVALNTIGFLAEHQAQAMHLPNIEKLLHRIKTAFFVFIVTGSYAKGKQKESSDLDVVIICDKDPNVILSQIKLESEFMVPEIHPYVFTQEQFYKMLVAEEENYGKETARHHLIITGGRMFYSILQEAILHGFDG